MKALTFAGPGQRVWHELPDPVLLDRQDAIVRVDATTICGTDLHILAGHVPSVTPGRVLGHEAVGTVEEVGSGVYGLARGDRVVVSAIAGCGLCHYCRLNRAGQCLSGGGWTLGHLIDGTQAERVRVPFATRALHHLPDSISDEQGLMLADVLPTAYEVGVLNGQVTPGSTVVIVGAGPVGLAALLTARLLAPSWIVVVEPNPARRATAETHGADVVVADQEDALGAVHEVTDGLGAHTAIEAAGTPEAFGLCAVLLRPGGHLASIGGHGRPVTLHLERFWTRSLTITTGMVDTVTTPTLLRLMAAGRLDAGALVTHRFDLDEIQDAYDAFSRAPDSGALKVAVLNR